MRGETKPRTRKVAGAVGSCAIMPTEERLQNRAICDNGGLPERMRHLFRVGAESANLPRLCLATDCSRGPLVGRTMSIVVSPHLCNPDSGEQGACRLCL